MNARFPLSRVAFAVAAVTIHWSCQQPDASVGPHLLGGVGDASASGAISVTHVSDDGTLANFRADWPGGAATYSWDARPLDSADSPKQFGEVGSNSVMFALALQASPYQARFQVWERLPSGKYKNIGGQLFTVARGLVSAEGPCGTSSGTLILGDDEDGSLVQTDCQLQDRSYADRWEFTLASTTPVEIYLRSNFDSYLYLAEAWVTDPSDPEQASGILGEDDHYLRPSYARITTSLEAGAYAVYATTSSPDDDLGSYNISLSVDECGLNTGELSFGEGRTGALGSGDCQLSSGAYAERWEFRLTEAMAVQIDLTASDFDDYLFLVEPWVTDPHDPDQTGGIIAQNDGAFSTYVAIPLAPGTYALYASSVGAKSTGAYELSVGPVPPCSAGDVIELAADVSGELHAAGCRLLNGRRADRWEFVLTDWTAIEIDLISNEFDAYLFLVDPSVRDPTDPAQSPGILAEDDDGMGFNSRITIALPAGKYALYTSTYAPEEGGLYELSLREISCLVDADTDGDRLADCHETNTGIYEDLSDTGTDPFNPDTDGDAINDGDEVLGTVDGLQLRAMGASPLQKDILVEYDWFDDALHCGPHSHRPDGNELFHVLAFAEAPVPNPGRWDGINLIQDFGQGGVFTGGNLIDDPDAYIDWPEFYEYRDQHLAPNRRGYFHYVILGHQKNDTEWGIAHSNRSDGIVMQMGCLYLDDWKMAGTLMHELGHNLSLSHGGDDEVNYKPNYNSVMNYRYGSGGVDAFGCDAVSDSILDFSRGTRPDLDENNLNEHAGVCGGWNPLDWNRNGVIEERIRFDINAPPPSSTDPYTPRLTVLHDYDDWSNLFFGGPTYRSTMAAANRGPVTCDFGRREPP